jgi:HK97 family phage major capsid protein
MAEGDTMTKDTPNGAVDKTADALLGNEAFQGKLAEMIGAAIGKAATPATPEAKSVRQIVYETMGHFEKKPEIKNPIGAMVIAAYHGKNDPERAAQFAKAKWGDGNPVQKDFEIKAVKALTSATSGGAVEMVQETVASEVIEALRPASIVRSSGVQIVPNPTGTLNIPRVATGVSITWLGEAAASNATQQVFDTVTLTRKKAMIKVPVTKELIMFATPDAEQAIADDVVGGMATGTDLAYIRGSGGSSPVGVREQVAAGNVSTSNGNDAADVEQDFADLFEDVRGNNVAITPENGFIWMNTRSVTFLEKLRDANGNLIYPELRLDTPKIMRYRVMITNNIPNNLSVSGASPSSDESEIYFGRGPSILIADAKEMELEVLENVAYTNSGGSIESGVDLDTLLVKATLLTDLALRHTTSWAVKTGIQYGVTSDV